MAIELKMPALSPTMEKGTLARWLVAQGASIKAGDVLAEIETDKATMEFEAVDEGVIASIIVPEGTDDVAVGTVIALIGEAGDAAAPALELADVASEAIMPRISAPTLDKASAPTMSAQLSDTNDGTQTLATPLARRIATVRGLSLLGVAGTGPRGRIVKADLGLGSAIEPPAVAAGAVIGTRVHAPPTDVPMTRDKLSSMRKTIARRLTEAKQTVPHFYLTAHCRIDALLKLRGELNATLSSRGIRLSVNDLVTKAMALALLREPEANVQFAGDELYRFDRVDVAMAVAIDGGLVTPVIRDVASLSLSAIAEQSKHLATKARDGKLLTEEYQGGTVSISNLGMYGIDEMIPVINPPHALILGIGTGIEKPWKVDGAVALATIMSATASFDHRAIDGAAAARFMAAFRDLVEQPVQLLC